ncbi:MAG: aspartyl-phosphate phosphatase Spo0E family protein [Clostridiales bacterium]|jgi:hypothetical protein|nr:aspartyl-phosphate phosphatase Spo0E family protein [Clostridiales bacterium]
MAYRFGIFLNARLAILMRTMRREREKLNLFCDKYGLTSEETLKASHKFDKLHIKYVFLKKMLVK